MYSKLQFLVPFDCAFVVHISRNGGQIIFSIFPHFWYVCKACNASRCTLLKKMKKSHVDYEIFENQKSRLAIPINSLNVL